MDLKELMPFVLLLLFIGMLIGVGVLTLDKYSVAVRDTTSVTATNKNLSAAGTIDFTQENCLTVTSVFNSTTTFDLDNYNVTFSNPDECILSYSGFGTACRGPATKLCNITYTYGADTPTSSASGAVTTAISGIASTWMGLIVTVVVLSLIMGLVLTSFGGRR